MKRYSNGLYKLPGFLFLVYSLLVFLSTFKTFSGKIVRLPAFCIVQYSILFIKVRNTTRSKAASELHGITFSDGPIGINMSFKTIILRLQLRYCKQFWNAFTDISSKGFFYFFNVYVLPPNIGMHLPTTPAELTLIIVAYRMYTKRIIKRS